jgi:hypothetical protein
MFSLHQHDVTLIKVLLVNPESSAIIQHSLLDPFFLSCFCSGFIPNRIEDKELAMWFQDGFEFLKEKLLLLICQMADEEAYQSAVKG